MQGMIDATKERWHGALIVVALVAYLILCLRDAWVGDDIFITLRSVKQWVYGGGLVWNPGERVQAYTHPLWMMLLSLCFAITREAYFTTLSVSIFISLAAAGHLAFRVADRRLVGAVAVGILASSRAVIDYSSSGLENPLTHLLLLLFLGIYFHEERWSSTPKRPHGTRRLLVLTFLAALGMCNRMDSALLFAPPVLFVLIQCLARGASPLKCLKTLLLGGLPFIAWEIFSLIYYGTFVPNTALAKLNTGIPSHELFLQGIAFFYESLYFDHVTLVVILAGLCIPWLSGDRRHYWVSAGVILHLLYMLKIGGDFMSGRFLTPPLVVTVALLTQLPRWQEVRAATLMVIVLLLNLSSPRTTLPIAPPRKGEGRIDQRGIADERGFYMGGAGLEHMGRGIDAPHRHARYTGESLNPHHVHIKGALGYVGFHASRSAYIVDHWALTDPLLSRIPALYNPKWRIGHFSRVLPEGYIDTLNSQENRFLDPKLWEFYQHIRRITRDPIFSKERWRSIWKLQSGQLDHLVDKPRYRFHGAKELKASELLARPRKGPDAIDFGHSGIHIDLETGAEKLHDEILVFDLDADDDQQLIYYDGQRELGRSFIPRSVPRHYTPRKRIVEVPPRIASEGYTHLRIIPKKGHDPFRLWHFHHAPNREAEKKLAKSLKEAEKAKKAAAPPSS